MIVNQIKTVFLIALLSGLLAALGYLCNGPYGGLYALCIAAIVNGITYWYADRIVLRLYNAKPLAQSEHKKIHETVAELCDTIKIPFPRLYLIKNNMPNAFATGRNPHNAAIALTSGIIDLLEPHELRGVLAHELAHIRNRDILVATLAATIATSISYLADMVRWSLFWSARGKNNENRGSGAGLLLIAMLTPFIVMLLQLAISRSREYLADEKGADCCKDPLALASALRKMQDEMKNNVPQPASTAHASAASLFIVYPFKASGLFSLFSTHPPLHKRIARLEQMATK